MATDSVPSVLSVPFVPSIPLAEGTQGTERTEGTNSLTETRETLLWDLAGQPGYRLVHQLHLGEVAVALVLFDARSETEPLSIVRPRPVSGWRV